MYSIAIVSTLVFLIVYLVIDGYVESKRKRLDSGKTITPKTINLILEEKLDVGDNILAVNPKTGEKLIGIIKSKDPETVMMDSGHIIPDSYVVGKIV